MSDRIRVGVVGAHPERGWARTAHLPALRASDDYEIAAIAARDPGAAAAVWGAPLGFTDAHELATHPDVDLVVAAVPVPSRDGVVEAAIAAGKHVYCEWPLAFEAPAAAALRDRASAAGVQHVIGLQSRHHPALRHLRELLADGWVGEVLSASLSYSLSTPAVWPARYASLLRTKAVSRLIIVGGHALDLFRRGVGNFAELSATVATRLPFAELDTGEKVELAAPDQISVTGTLESGAVGTVRLVTGGPHGSGFRVEVHGRKGRLALLSADDDLVGTEFMLYGSRRRAKPALLPTPRHLTEDTLPTAPPAVSNVRRVYADLAAAVRAGTTPAEPDFGTAVEVHELLDAIEKSAASGRRETLGG